MDMLNPKRFGRLARLPIVSTLFSSLLGVGFDSRRERSLNKVLIVSTIFLQLGSGYTTWAGLCQYVPWIVSFFVTLAIQGLLFASSWRLGAALFGRNFKISLLIVYFITMGISVFFSYSSLLDRVYLPEHRDQDQLQRAKSSINILATDLNQNLDKKLFAISSNCQESLSRWSRSVNSVAASLLAPQRDLRAKYEAKRSQLNALSQRERETGGTIVTIQGRKYISPKGRGEIAREYEEQADEFLYGSLNPLQAELNTKEDSLAAFNALLTKMTSSADGLSLPNVSALSDSWEILVGRFPEPRQRASLPVMPPNVRVQVSEFQEISSVRRSGDLSSLIIGAPTVIDLKNAVYSYLSHLTFLDSVYRQKLFKAVDRIGRYEGLRAHPFELALGEIENLNPLAFGSLLVAISIDILVLFCGLLGARPDSYLDIKKPDDLADIQEIAVETVLSLDVNGRTLDSVTDVFIRRIVEILRRSRPDVDYAYKGFPAMLTSDDVSALGMGKEIGVLFALQLAEQLPDGRIGLRTRLILWLADQVLRHLDAEKVTGNLDNSIDVLEDFRL